MNKKKVAVIGYGGMGGWHVRYIQTSDVVALAGVYDIKPERMALAAEKEIYGYPSLEAVFADKSVDIVVLATPNELHKPMAIAAMRAEKHVISEKPVTLSSADLKEMVDAANKYNKIFSVHQNRRFDADFQMVRDICKTNELGEIFGIESRIQGSRGIPGDWRGKKEHGGGMILDWGVHLIDQMLQIIPDKKITKLYCVCDHITNYEVDDGFKLDLHFENDVTARIEVGTSHFASLPRFYVTGTNGSAIINDWKENMKVISCKNWDEKDVIPVVTSAGLTKTMAPRDSKTVEESEIVRPTPDVHDYYRNFVLAVDGKAKQMVTHEEMMRVMKIMEAAFRSDSTGLPVSEIL